MRLNTHILCKKILIAIVSAFIVLFLVMTCSFIFHLLTQSNRPYKLEVGKAIVLLLFFFAPTLPTIVFMELKKLTKFKHYFLSGFLCPLITFLLIATLVKVVPIIVDALNSPETVKPNAFNNISPQGLHKSQTTFPVLLIYAPMLGVLFTSFYWIIGVNQKNRREVLSDLEESIRCFIGKVIKHYKLVVLILALIVGSVIYKVQSDALKHTYSEQVLFYIENERLQPIYAIAQGFEYGSGGQEKDMDKAIELYLVSAKLGYRPSQEQLAKTYLKFYGGNDNLVEAYAWFFVVAFDKHQRPDIREKAKTKLLELEPRLIADGHIVEAKKKGQRYSQKYILFLP